MSNRFPSVIVGYDKQSLRSILIEEHLRPYHLYILGRSGTGKSTLIQNLLLEDIESGSKIAIALIDPAGDLALNVLKTVPQGRVKDVVYFSTNSIIPYNILQTKTENPDTIINEFIDLIDRVTKEQSSTAELSTRMKRLLRRCLKVLMKKQDATILDIESVLLDKEYRYSLISKLKINESELISFWKKGGTYDNTFRELRTTIDSILDRIDQFISDRRVRYFTCGGNELDFNNIIDKHKIFIVNLAGLEGSFKHFVGSLIVHGLERAAMDRLEERRKPLAFYVDEFQNYISSGFETILSQGRKYLISLCLAHQNHSQIPEKLLGAVLGNVGAMVVFNCGSDEARRMASEFGVLGYNAVDNQPVMMKYHDFLTLENHVAFIKKGNSISLIKTFPPAGPLRNDITTFLIKAKRKEDQEHSNEIEMILDLKEENEVGTGWMYFEAEGRERISDG